MSTIVIKTGDSFDQLVNLPSSFADGYFVDWTLSSQIRSARYGYLISNLVCEWLDPALTRTVRLTLVDTTSWVPQDPLITNPNAAIDIQLTRNSDSFVVSTATIDVSIIRDVTLPGSEA